jgi:hypothetical protein
MFNDFFIGISSSTASTDSKIVVFTLMRMFLDGFSTDAKVIIFALVFLAFFVSLVRYFSDPEEGKKELEKSIEQDMKLHKIRNKCWKFWVAKEIIGPIITVILILFFAYKVSDYLFG